MAEFLCYDIKGEDPVFSVKTSFGKLGFKIARKERERERERDMGSELEEDQQQAPLVGGSHRSSFDPNLKESFQRTGSLLFF